MDPTHLIGLIVLAALGMGVLHTLTPTNRYFNSSDWSFNSVDLTGITGAAYDEGISVKKEAADFDLFPTVGVVDYHDPKVTLDTLDAFALMATAAGVRSTLTGNIRDAKNGVAVGGGGKSITMTGAAIEGRNMNAQFREYGKQQLVFGSVATDGATHPVAIAAL